MTIRLVFETHSITEDNERSIATGWHHGRLSEAGRESARALGERRRDDGIDAVFASDLGRAVETATIAFAETPIPVLLDWRLRECDYGDLNSTGKDALHGQRGRYFAEPHPRGESWRQSIERVGLFLRDLPLRWDGKRVLVIGHMSTRFAMRHYLAGVEMEKTLHEDFAWQPGWEYTLDVR